MSVTEANQRLTELVTEADLSLLVSFLRRSNLAEAQFLAATQLKNKLESSQVSSLSLDERSALLNWIAQGLLGNGFCLWQLRKEVQNVIMHLAAKLVKTGWFEMHEQNSQEPLQAAPIKSPPAQQ